MRPNVADPPGDAVAVPPPPWGAERAADAGTARRALEVVRTVVVDAPARDAVAVVNDIAALADTERKADRVAVRASSPTTGTYRVEGRIAGLVPWRATFSYELSPHGFRSVSAPPPRRGWDVAGGFVVRPVDAERSEIVHYEQYLVPTAWRWIKPALRAYMRRSMRGELADLAAKAQARRVRAR